MDVKSAFFYVFAAVLLFAAFRVITARNPVQAALFLVSPQSSQVTGQTISVNGGLSFGGW